MWQVYSGLPNEDNDFEALSNEQRREARITAQAADGEQGLSDDEQLDALYG